MEKISKGLIVNVYNIWMKHNNKSKNWKSLIDTDSITIFEHPKIGIKTECVLKCCSNRLFKLMSDVHWLTRRQWDRTSHFGLGMMKKLKILEILEEDSERQEYLYFIEFQLLPNNANYDCRYFQGAFWINVNQKMCIFTSIQNPLYKKNCPPECTLAEATFTCVIRTLEPYKSCYMSTLLMDCDYGGHISNVIDCKLLHDQIEFISTLAATPALYDKIYDLWKCKCNSSSWYAAHVLECSICKQGRFGNCADLTCLAPLEEKGAEKCPVCKLSTKK